MKANFQYVSIALLAFPGLGRPLAAEDIEYDYLHIDYSKMTYDTSAADYEGTGLDAMLSYSRRAPLFVYARYERHHFDDLYLTESSTDIGSGIFFNISNDISAFLTFGYAGVNWSTIIGSIPNFGSTSSVGIRGRAFERLELQASARYMDLSRLESKLTYEIDGRLWLINAVAIGWTGQFDADGNFTLRIGGRIQW